MNANIFENVVNNVLKEYSSDQRLPFDDDQFKNKNYLEQYTDWLEDFGKYGTLPPSKLDFWSEIERATKYILEKRLDKKYWYENMNMDLNEILNVLKNIIGKYVRVNKNNLVYVERKVKIEKSVDYYNSSDENGNDRALLYKSLVQNYNNNVGGCWSYKKNGSEAYCKEYNGDTITMKGYIRTDDIDFVKTVLLNYSYSDEHEIRVNPNAKVELVQVDFNGKYKIPLKGHLIVNSTYFGNNGKYKGMYAPVDDGFGNHDYINRKGEIRSLDDLKQIIKSKDIDLNDYFDEVKELNNGFTIIKFLNRWTFITPNRDLINNGDLWFDDISDFTDGYAIVTNGKRKTFINMEGRLFKNGLVWGDDIIGFHNHHAAIKISHNWYVIDDKENLVYGDMAFDEIVGIGDNYIGAYYNGVPYFIDFKGNFYDYDTEKPIQSPLDDDMYKLDYYLQQNGRRRRKYENKESINKIISEVLNYFLIKNVNK